MIAGYIRVSSRAQDYATQRAALERAAAARGDEITRWFAETRRGRAAQRPELDDLIQAVHEGSVRRVYVFRLDRLTRRGMRDTLAVVEQLTMRGVELVSTSEAWFDLHGPFRDLLLAVLGWAAQHEVAVLGERISAARLRVEAEGRPWGRPARCDLALVARIDAMASQGRSQRTIAKALKVPRPTVANVLARKGPYASVPRTSQIPLPAPRQRGAAK